MSSKLSSTSIEISKGTYLVAPLEGITQSKLQDENLHEQLFVIIRNTFQWENLYEGEVDQIPIFVEDSVIFELVDATSYTLDFEYELIRC